MSYISKIYSNIQKEVAEKEPFNEDLIYFRQNENIEELLRGIFSSLESIKGVKLKQCKMDYFDNIYENKTLSDKRKKNRQYYDVDIEKSRFMSVKVVVELTDNTGDVKDHELNLLYPELIDGQYYYIGDNKYFPVFQLVDAEFYRAGREAIVLKTLFMPLRLNGKTKDVLVDIDGDLSETLKGRIIYLDIFKGKKIPAPLFYFAMMGVEETLKFLDLDPYMNITESGMEPDPAYFYFKLNKGINLEVNKEWLLEDIRYRNSMVLTIQELFKRLRIGIDKVEDQGYWKRSLGEKFTKNTNPASKLEKCDSILISFERIMDEYTKKILRIPDEDKKDTKTIVRFMMKHYESICRMDPHHLDNKRMRIGEHLLYPLAQKISNTTYRMVNFKESQRTMKSLKGMFSAIGEDFLIKNIISNSLMRYSNSVNTIDLLSRNLKASKTGAQSSTKKSSPSVTTKSINASYIGRADLVSTSSNEPGISFSLVPTVEVKDPNNEGMFFFSDKPLIEDFDIKSYEDDDELNPEDEYIEIDLEDEGKEIDTQWPEDI